MVSRRKPNCREKAIRLLAVRDRSVSELKQRLLRGDYAAEEVDQVIAWLLDIGYLDDGRLAASFVEQKNRLQPCGNALLRYKLQELGISDEIIAKVLNPPEIERELAKQALEKRCRQRSKQIAASHRVPENKQKQKLMNFLVRRGFSIDVARQLTGNEYW